MTPTPSVSPYEGDTELKKQIAWCLGEEIVISGISGRFPDADSIEEFKEKLYEGVDLVTVDDRRWPPGIYGTGERLGKLKNISHFDASAFGINSKLANEMDPQMRIFLEATQEAILDAGISPPTIRGSRTGVFLGSTCMESMLYWNDAEDMVHGYGLLGASLSMFANRISFTFDFKGPSFGLDASCSSSLQALQQAVISINTGACENAIVAGSNLTLQPTKSLQYQRLHLLSSSDISKPFDDNSDGFERSEAVVVCFLQKRREAKRVYAEILSTVCNHDGNKEVGPINVSYENQLETIKQAVEEAGVKPEQVAFVETHAMGTKLGDSAEVNALHASLCKNRSEPLLIGSVKSNIGHSEGAAGLCSLIKVLLAFETGIIPPNIHYEKPNRYIPALINSQIKVVDKPTPLKEGSVVAVNSIGLGGTTGIVLLRGNSKTKIAAIDANAEKPRLLCVSGRNATTINATLDKAIKYKDNEEFLHLLNEAYSKDISGYDWKGYAVITDDVVKEVQVSGGSERPVWFVFSGMGSQWAGMARDIIKIPICKKAIDNVHEILLKREGYNLYEHLLSDDESTFDNILHSVCSITSIQIALTNLLYSLDISPDGFIGHSAGEVGCAYADGTLTAEEAILTSYYRGCAILESNIPPGAMAAVGLTWEETKNRVPEGIYAVCHNSVDSVTVCGLPEQLKNFVSQLKQDGVFAREVKSSGFAFHSKYISNAGPLYKEYLEKVIKKPKRRTQRWISTSVEESKWDSELAQYSGPEYHVNNLLNPVLFEEGFKHIPKNAIVLEIAPHHLMFSVLKRALGPKTTVIGLLKRQHKNNVEYVLSNIGKFFLAGGYPNLNKLLDSQPNYPVPRGTPMLQSIVQWDHSNKWVSPGYSTEKKAGTVDIVMDLSTDEYSFIGGHKVDGRIVVPGVTYTVLAWQVFAKLHGVPYENFPVVLSDVQFMRATFVPEGGAVTFTISYLNSSKSIEISEGSATLMKCNIRKAGRFDEESMNFPMPLIHRDETIILDLKSEIYKFYSILGFTYSGGFLGIHEFDASAKYTTLEFHDNYITFLDTMLQFPFYSYGITSLHLPIQIKRLLIDPIAHRKIVESCRKHDGLPIVPAFHDDHILCIKAGGMEMRGMAFNPVSAKSHAQNPLIEKYQLVPYYPEDNQNFDQLDVEQIIRLFTHIVIENNTGVYDINVLEYLCDTNAEESQAPLIMTTIETVPLNKLDAVVTVVREGTNETNVTFSQSGISYNDEGLVSAFPSDQSAQFHFIVVRKHIDESLFGIIKNILLPGGFLLVQGSPEIGAETFEQLLNFQSISRIVSGENAFNFFRKPAGSYSNSHVNIDETYDWVENLKFTIKEFAEAENPKILLVGKDDATTGILGLVNCLKLEPGCSNIRCLFVKDSNVPEFSLEDPFYSEQIKKDLVMNVYENGKWGSYRHLLIPGSKDNKIPTKYAYLNSVISGDITTISWIQECPVEYEYSKKELKSRLCYVYYTPITDKDIQFLTLKGSKYVSSVGGRDHEFIGMEFSGRDANGKRIMGMVRDKALATTVFSDSDLVWEVPEDWTLEQACVVPQPFATVYYALIIRGKLKPNESVLIEHGEDTLAQAAISVCLSMNCKLYISGNEHTFLFLKATYPEIPDDQLIDNETSVVSYELMKRTKCKGVNVIFNSTGDANAREMSHCLTKNGRFIDIQKNTDRNVSYANFMEQNLEFHRVYPEEFFDGSITEENKIKTIQLVQEGIDNGVIVPTLTTLFTNVDKAISYVIEGKYLGNVVLQIKEEENDDSEVELTPALVNAIPQTYFNPKKSYIVLGGFGGFGIELCKFMMNRKAKYVVVVSRSGVKTNGHRLVINEYNEAGGALIVSTADCTTLEGAKEVIEEAEYFAPVGGIFNLAAVLKDGIFENLTAADFESVCNSKIKATKNLDTLSRQLCPELEYFVTFSSVSCGRGNAGQTNYGFANSAMDRICENRVAAGYPGLSIQWGAIGDVGLLLEKSFITDDIEVGGIIPQKLRSCLDTFDYFLQQKEPVLSTTVLAARNKNNNSTQLKPADVVANILGIKDLDSINKNATLVELGTDSLTTVEIKQHLERKFKIILSAPEILQLTFAKLEELS